MTTVFFDRCVFREIPKNKNSKSCVNWVTTAKSFVDLKKTFGKNDPKTTQITNVFWGDMRQEIFNSQTFVDTKNNMRATVNYGPPVIIYIHVCVCVCVCVYVCIYIYAHKYIYDMCLIHTFMIYV
jgi:hypothetical protein